MGKDEKTLLGLAARQNMPIPEKILNAPDLEPGLQIYLDCFNDLTHSRFSSSGYVGRIHYDLIDLWCSNNGVWADQKLDMLYIIAKMDTVYVAWQLEAMKRLSKKEAQPTTRPPPRRRK